MSFYIELNCEFQSNQPELLSAYLITELGAIGFETFEENLTGLKAYIPESDYNAFEVDLLMNDIPAEFGKSSWIITKIEQKNWNAEWEKHFNPVVVNNSVLIKASFHQNLPPFPYEILIDPKMSFGTGHHATTALMIRNMLGLKFTDKHVLDMGCGTGVLAILAYKLGAASITAIDIDEWAVSNSRENIVHNGIVEFQLIHGGVETIPHQQFDIILANINRNILLSDIPAYSEALKSQGKLLVSGIYHTDLDMVRGVAEENNLNYKNHIEKNSWIAAIFTKG